MKRTRVRLAVSVLLVLLAAGALAPLLANELPLAVRSPGGWTFPAFAALELADFLWFAALIAALGLLVPCRGRTVMVAIAATVVVFGAAFHRTRVDMASAAPAADATRILAPVPFGFRNTDLGLRYAAPFSSRHWLGTDEIGRDVLARLLHGLRLSLFVGFAATALSLCVGVGLGAWAGSGGRISDAIASWIVQMSFCLPAVFVVATVQSVGRASLLTVILVLALLRFGVVARLTRQECLRIRRLPFVLAARGLGLHPWRVFVRHVLPNALIPATVAAAFGVAGAILAEAGLSFLGLGVPEPNPSLGRMLSDGRRAIPLGSHLVWLPGLILLVLVLACHAIGAAWRDAVDPRGAEATS